jgi:hypothetical protein
MNFADAPASNTTAAGLCNQLHNYANDHPCNQLHEPLDDRVAFYTNAARSSATRRAYASDLAAFSAWGGRVPASPETVASYLAASDLLAAATLRRRLAAIADAHQALGYPDPTKHPLVRKVFRGIRRIHGARADASTPLDIDMLARIVAALPNDLAAIRDRALLLVGFFCALRRSELVALAVEDLDRHPDGWTITIQRSKTDPYGRGQYVPLPVFHGPLCPTAAVAQWLAIAAIAEGPVFRAISPDHKIASTLPAPQVGSILRTRALKAGLDVQRLSTWLEPKIAGGCRQLVSFHWKRRALQLMCGDILSVAYPAAPFDYSARGNGGVKAATIFLHKLITEGNYQYVVTVDVKDCFGSAIKKKVGELLPLPEKVVNNVLLVQDDVTVVVKPDGAKWKGLLFPNHLPAVSIVATDEAARRGVPQGSSASGIIMYRVVLGPLLCTLPFADRIVLVGDDLAVPVKDMLEGEAVLKALKSLYAASPVGLLTIGRHSVSHIKDGFDFASYRTRLKPKWKAVLDGVTEWYLHLRPTLRAYEKSEHKAAKKYHDAGGGLPGWKQVILYKKRWMASFPLWKPSYFSKLYLWLELQAGSWH